MRAAHAACCTAARRTRGPRSRTYPLALTASAVPIVTGRAGVLRIVCWIRGRGVRNAIVSGRLIPARKARDRRRGGRGHSLTTNFKRYWQAAVKAAGITGFRFHNCRHTFASRLVNAGVDRYAVQAAGGWKTASMMQRYAHLEPATVRAAVEPCPTAIECKRTPGWTPTGSRQSVRSDEHNRLNLKWCAWQESNLRPSD